MESLDSFSEIEVEVKHLKDGPEGIGWYAWDDQYPEEGYFLFQTEKPSLRELREAYGDVSDGIKIVKVIYVD